MAYVPRLVDEWQLVPEVLGAIKRAVDDEPGPRRFVITGSSQADLTAAGWPATGRMVRVPIRCGSAATCRPARRTPPAPSCTRRSTTLLR